MRLSEVFLRLGCSLVAWMVLYAHLLWLAVAARIGCGPDGDEMHRLLLGMAPLTIGFSFLVRATRPFDDIHRMLRWLGVPLGLLVPFAVLSVWQTFARVNVDGLDICVNLAAPAWQRWWVTAQALVVVIVVAMVVRAWRAPGPAERR